MTNLIESSTWESGIYQLETDDPTLGGQPGFNMGEPVTGHANAQALQLANRTSYLKNRVDIDLSNPADPTKGAAMVGYKGGTVRSALDSRTITVESLVNISNLPVVLNDGQTVYVRSFYTGGNAGGGVFFWDQSRPKSQHNVGTVIDPDRISAWNGTQSDITTLFNKNLTGSGCFVRVNNTPHTLSEYDVQWWGLGLSGVYDVHCWNAVISYINSIGAVASSNLPISVIFPAGQYDLTSPGINSINTTNLDIQMSSRSMVKMKDSSIFIFGDTVSFAENITIRGGFAYTDPGVDPSNIPTDVAWVSARNAARIDVYGLRGQRVPRVANITALSGKFTTSFRFFDCRPTGMPDREQYYIDSRLALAGAGIALYNCGGFPYGVPANPDILPKAISGVSNGNPAVITCASHGYSTGDRIRFMNVGGTTELNGNDYTITSINANSFSLNGVDGSTLTPYTSGGACAERHWSWAYDKAVCKILGKWDTAQMETCFFMHWAYLWDIEATESSPIVYVWDKNTTFDYGGAGRFRLTFSGGSISNVDVSGGWHFSLDDSYCKIVTNSPSGALLSFKVDDHKIGLVGGSILPNSGRYREVSLSNIQIGGSNRLSNGTSYGFQFSEALSYPKLTNVRYLDSRSGYGNDAIVYLIPDIGISCPTAMGNISIVNCELAGKTSAYDLPFRASLGNRNIRNNRKLLGGRPEYITVGTPSPAITTGTWEWVNNTGHDLQFSVRSGTVSSIGISYRSTSTGNDVVQPTGLTSGVFILGHEQKIQIVSTVAPTVYFIPI